MKPLKKIFDFFFSSTIGGWFFVVGVLSLLGIASYFYLDYYGTPNKNSLETLQPHSYGTLNESPLKTLQPLAVVIFGFASAVIALINIWGKLGHKLMCKIYCKSSSREPYSDMIYISNMIICNRKNKAEVIDKILFLSKKQYTTLVDFYPNPLVLKNYETKNIEMEPVTAWIKNVNNSCMREFSFPSLGSDDTFTVNTIKEREHPIIYVTHRNYNTSERKISSVKAVTLNGIIPIQIGWGKFNVKSILPIRNTEKNSIAPEETVYRSNVIQVTNLILGKSNAGKEPKNKKIKIILCNDNEEYIFINHKDKTETDVYKFFSGLTYIEKRNFESMWEKYYEKEKIKAKASVIKEFKQLGKDIQNHKKEILHETEEKLKNFFHEKISSLFLNKDLPKISSKITSKMFFLKDEAKKIEQYPILRKEHTLFVTALYPTEPVHPCFEEIEKSAFYKMRHKIRHWLRNAFSRKKEARRKSINIRPLSSRAHRAKTLRKKIVDFCLSFS